MSVAGRAGISARKSLTRAIAIRSRKLSMNTASTATGQKVLYRTPFAVVRRKQRIFALCMLSVSADHILFSFPGMHSLYDVDFFIS